MAESETCSRRHQLKKKKRVLMEIFLLERLGEPN